MRFTTERWIEKVIYILGHDAGAFEMREKTSYDHWLCRVMYPLICIEKKVK